MTSSPSPRSERSRAPDPPGRPSCRPDDFPPHDPPRTGPARSSRPERHHGQALVEFALLAPVLLFLILGSIDAGRLLIAKASQDAQTIEAARWAVAHPDQAATDGAVAIGIDPDCTVDTSEDPDAGTVSVSVVCTFLPLTTHGLWDGLPISSEATAAYAAGAVAGETSPPSASPSASIEP